MRFLSRILGLDGSRRPRPNRRVLSVEALQERVLPAVLGSYTLVGTFTSVPTVSVVNGHLQITGTNGDDVVGVTPLLGGGVLVNVNGVNQAFNAVDHAISFWGKDGNDRFTNSTALRSFAYGMGGNDTLRGGSNADHFDGGYGNDWLFGGGGDDYLDGGWDADVIYGEGGNDLLYANNAVDGASDVSYNYLDGGDGDDVMQGGFGVDHMVGNNGRDVINGDDGNDLIYGGSDDDELHGGNGHDSVLGQGGTDDVYGDDGNDFVDGGDDRDFVHGGFGDDVCCGGDGWDYVAGEDGDDWVSGGPATFDETNGIDVQWDPSDDDQDALEGGAGADVFFIGDPQYFLPRLDDARDESDEDYTIIFHVIAADFNRSPDPRTRWGHLYGT